MLPAHFASVHLAREHCAKPSLPDGYQLKRAAPVQAPVIVRAPTLSVYSISGRGWKETSKTAKTWEIQARQTLKSLRRESEYHSLLHNSIDHCQALSEAIAEGPVPDHSLLTCQHGIDIYAIALFNHKTNHLLHIVSNPKNLVGVSRIKDAPTKIMLCLANHVLRNSTTLTAKINDVSTDFFCKKLQFIPAPELTTERDLVSRTPTVQLTADKIAELVRKRVPPFDQLC
jgi:hypothetical protein